MAERIALQALRSKCLADFDCAAARPSCDRVAHRCVVPDAGSSPADAGGPAVDAGTLANDTCATAIALALTTGSASVTVDPGLGADDFPIWCNPLGGPEAV